MPASYWCLVLLMGSFFTVIFVLFSLLWDEDIILPALVTGCLISIAFIVSVRGTYHRDEQHYDNATILKTEAVGTRNEERFMVWITTDNEDSICITVEKDAFGRYEKGMTVDVTLVSHYTWLFNFKNDYRIGGNHA